MRLAEICKNITAVELSKMIFDNLLSNNPVIRSYCERALLGTNEHKEKLNLLSDIIGDYEGGDKNG